MLTFWDWSNVGLDDDGIWVGLALRHLWSVQRLEFGFDQFNFPLTTIDRRMSYGISGDFTLASKVNFPTDGTNSVGVLGTRRIAESVLLDATIGAAALQNSNSTVSDWFIPTTLANLWQKRWMNISVCSVRTFIKIAPGVLSRPHVSHRKGWCSFWT